MNLHIHAPAGKYIAQVRKPGHRLWETVGKPTKCKRTAAKRAVGAMVERGCKRARVLWCSEWYEPTVVMEAHI